MMCASTIPRSSLTCASTSIDTDTFSPLAASYPCLAHEYDTLHVLQRLGVVSEDGWEPNDAARVVLAEMGPPLNFFVLQSEDDSRSKEERGVSSLQ